MNYVATYSYSTQQYSIIDNHKLSQTYDQLTGCYKFLSPKFFSPKDTQITFQVALEQNGSVYLRFGSNQITGRNSIQRSRPTRGSLLYVGVNATAANSRNEQLKINFKFKVEFDVEKNRNSGYGAQNFVSINEENIVKSAKGKLVFSKCCYLFQSLSCFK